jgi:hypothetical protein
MEAHTAFGNKIVRGVVSENIFKGSNMVVKDVKLTKEEMNDMNYRLDWRIDNDLNDNFFMKNLHQKTMLWKALSE